MAERFIEVTQAQLQSMTYDTDGYLTIEHVVFPDVASWAVHAQSNILGNGDEPNIRVQDA